MAASRAWHAGCCDRPTLVLTNGPHPSRASGQPAGIVLLVEDEPLLLKSAYRMLSARGFTVLCAADAGSAITAADAAPDLALLLTDISLPDMDGRELATRLRQRRRWLPVLFMSGFDADQSRVALAEDGNWAFLPKPFSGRDLDTRLRKLIGTAGEVVPPRSG